MKRQEKPHNWKKLKKTWPTCAFWAQFCTLCTENRYVDLTDPKTLLVDVTRHHLWPNYQVWSRYTYNRPRNYKKTPFLYKNGQKCDEWCSCDVQCTAYWAICRTVVVISKLIYLPKMTPVKQGRVDPRGCGDIQFSARFVQNNVHENPHFLEHKTVYLSRKLIAEAHIRRILIF